MRREGQGPWRHWIHDSCANAKINIENFCRRVFIGPSLPESLGRSQSETASYGEIKTTELPALQLGGVSAHYDVDYDLAVAVVARVGVVRNPCACVAIRVVLLPRLRLLCRLLAVACALFR